MTYRNSYRSARRLENSHLAPFRQQVYDLYSSGLTPIQISLALDNQVTTLQAKGLIDRGLRNGHVAHRAPHRNPPAFAHIRFHVFDEDTAESLNFYAAKYKLSIPDLLRRWLPKIFAQHLADSLTTQETPK
jgi:hypothetical protein